MDKLDELRKISENSHNDKENQRYVLRYVVTAEILNIMEKNDIRKATLAKQLGYSKGHISRAWVKIKRCGTWQFVSFTIIKI